jgi:hypothetical protein
MIDFVTTYPRSATGWTMRRRRPLNAPGNIGQPYDPTADRGSADRTEDGGHDNLVAVKDQAGALDGR